MGHTTLCLYRFGGFQQIDSQFQVCLYRFENCNKSSLIHRCVYTDVNNFPKIICQYKYLNTLKQVTIWLQVNSHQTNLHLGQVTPEYINKEEFWGRGRGLGYFHCKTRFFSVLYKNRFKLLNKLWCIEIHGGNKMSLSKHLNTSN